MLFELLDDRDILKTKHRFFNKVFLRISNEKNLPCGFLSSSCRTVCSQNSKTKWSRRLRLNTSRRHTKLGCFKFCLTKKTKSIKWTLIIQEPPFLFSVLHSPLKDVFLATQFFLLLDRPRTRQIF